MKAHRVWRPWTTFPAVTLPMMTTPEQFMTTQPEISNSTTNSSYQPQESRAIHPYSSKEPMSTTMDPLQDLTRLVEDLSILTSPARTHGILALPEMTPTRNNCFQPPIPRWNVTHSYEDFMGRKVLFERAHPATRQLMLKPEDYPSLEVAQKHFRTIEQIREISTDNGRPIVVLNAGTPPIHTPFTPSQQRKPSQTQSFSHCYYCKQHGHRLSDCLVMREKLIRENLWCPNCHQRRIRKTVATN